MTSQEALTKLLFDNSLEHIPTIQEKAKMTAIIAKDLKALEIIKDICKIKVYKNKLGQCFLEGTNILYDISQEEYDLLKEVLEL